MRGHPAFKAMRATALCCRGCMEKWWKVPRGRSLPRAFIRRGRDGRQEGGTCLGASCMKPPAGS